MIKMAAVVVWRSQHRRNLRRNRVFRDRKNPLDMYDDVELYDKFRFRRHDIHEHEYVNRENFHSINVQVTCDLSNSLNFTKPLCNVTLF